MVEQAAGRRDDHVHAAAKGVLLRTHADAAVHRGAGDRRVDGERVQVLEDLRGQLARGRQDQRARRPPRPIDQPVKDRQQKRGGLAAAGLRARQDVASGERRRNRVRLNGRGSNESELANSLEQVGMELER